MPKWASSNSNLLKLTAEICLSCSLNKGGTIAFLNKWKHGKKKATVLFREKKKPTKTNIQQQQQKKNLNYIYLYS